MRAFRAGATAVLCATLGAAGGCRPTAIHDAEGSPEALARAVLQAIERGDAVRLRAVALSDEEFRAVVWPELPAARPERNLPLAYVWNDLRMKSEIALRRTMASRAGQPLELVRVRFPGGTTQYRTYLVHRHAVLTVRGADGVREDVRLFGSVFEQNGRFKVFSYVVD